MNAQRLILTALACSTAFAAAADPNTARTGAYQAGVSEEQLRVSTDRLKQEVADLIAEYDQYRTTTTEIATLKEATGTLDHVSANDMTGVVQGLMAASRSNDAAAVVDGLTKAGRDQKEIQAVLRALADKLTRHANEAALQKRLQELAVRQAANLRETRELAKENATDPKAPQDAKNKLANKRWEQTNLEKELKAAAEAVKKAAEDPQAQASEPAKEAARTAEAKQMTEHAKEAAPAMEKDLNAAADHQQKVLESLQSMVASLDKAKTEEDRNREMASELGDLAQKQQNLADRTPRVNEWEQQKAAEEQRNVADRLDAIKDRLSQLDANAGAKAEQSKQQAANTGDQIQAKEFRTDATRRGQASDNQRTVADQLSKLGEGLQKKAEQLAANSGQDSNTPSESSPQEEALKDAMKDLGDARANLSIANEQNKQQQDFHQRLQQARQQVDAARQKAQGAGEQSSRAMERALNDFNKMADSAAANDKVEHHLYHTRARVDDALRTLQDMSNQMLANQQRQRDNGPANDSHQNGMGNGSSGSRVLFNAAVSNGSDARREALSMLRQEKTAPGYEPQVNQYIKNLAEDDTAGK